MKPWSMAMEGRWLHLEAPKLEISTTRCSVKIGCTKATGRASKKVNRKRQTKSQPTSSYLALGAKWPRPFKGSHSQSHSCSSKRSNICAVADSKCICLFSIGCTSCINLKRAGDADGVTSKSLLSVTKKLYFCQ